MCLLQLEIAGRPHPLHIRSFLLKLHYIAPLLNYSYLFKVSLQNTNHNYISEILSYFMKLKELQNRFLIELQMLQNRKSKIHSPSSFASYQRVTSILSQCHNPCPEFFRICIGNKMKQQKTFYIQSQAMKHFMDNENFSKKFKTLPLITHANSGFLGMHFKNSIFLQYLIPKCLII